MTAALRAFVRERASRRYEYCRLHEDDADFLSFHVEHVVAKQHGGTDDPDLLCYACSECNWSKGPNLSGFFGGKIYPLFNPRKQSWKRHFRWERATLIGKTKTGKVTVRVLNINEPSRVMLREHLLLEGRFQPDG
jgi:HNH endonuclease